MPDPRSASDEELLGRCNRIRSGTAEDPKQAFRVAKELARRQLLEPACRLAEHIHGDEGLDPATAVEVRQKWALWTSKNPDRPDDCKHQEALEILDGIKTIEGGFSLERSTDPETLGIAGGICKRRWHVDGQLLTLERSLAFYERGAQQGIAADNGYTAINAAFVHDLLATLRDSTTSLPTAKAKAWREKVLAELPKLGDEPAYEDGPPRKEERWFDETLAEAHFGLHDYDAAKARLAEIDWDAVEAWEFETTARQFAWLARLHAPQVKSPADFLASEPWQVLQECFGGDPNRGAGSLFAGKLGLALSGGGFRASFYHIGVLAALAELDVLRHVEVLSCVSGGSILGAHYYLEVRKLLQECNPADFEGGIIPREKYIEIVERIAEDFLAGVQKNLRTRIASSPWANLRMAFVPGYGRTSRLGELYEKHLYARIEDADDKGRRERRLRKLHIRPKGDEDCKPKYDNWRRADKVPILILNATTVNTGHCWQFTASWMGEPPTHIESKIDGNYRLRRMYYGEAPKKHRDIRIGQAAAASSCVPGLFTPLELRNLYDGLTVRLIDGGVHDNQGVNGLLEQNCNVCVVSDASGQMSSLDQPGDGPLSVLLRSNSISMARVRGAEYRELDARQQSGRLKGMVFVHLKKELSVRDRSWKGCNNPEQRSPEDLVKESQSLAGYDILKTMQDKLARIRTDLDSFTELEAYALMTSGCKMVRNEFTEQIRGFPTHERQHPWKFLRVQSVLSDQASEDTERVSKLLDVSSQTAFKIWRLDPKLKLLAAALALVAVVVLGYAAWAWRGEPFATARGATAAAATLGVTLLLGSLGLGGLVKAIQHRKTLHQILVGIGLSLVGALGAWTHLRFFDPKYLELGKVSEAEKGDAGGRAE